MSGSCRSSANTWRPLSLSTVSSRFTGVPMIVHCAGSLTATVSGTANCDAAAASSPYRSVRPVGVWVMTLLAAEHSPTGTPHCAAAACTSMARAAAPPLRT